MHVRVGYLIVGFAVSLVAVAPAHGQPKAAKSGTKPAASDASAAFKKSLDDWKKVVAELRKKNFEYRQAKPEDREKILDERKEIIARSDALEPVVVKSAEAAFLADKNNKDAADLLAQLSNDYLQREKYDDAIRMAKLLVQNGFDNPALYAVAGEAAFDTNDFDDAVKYLDLGHEARTLTENNEQIRIVAADEKDKWKKEQAIRAAEEKANDLPRVKLTTDKGDIVVELFENEAPNTVANFISLAGSGAYDGTPFHRVLRGFMAQGGDPNGDGTGGPGYTIPCECYADNHRNHFRGTLSMAHAGKNTGGSQFFINFVPTPHLDGLHTVFGRAISGFDVLDSLQRRDPSLPTPPAPDKIIKAEVVRKRNHDYVPKKMADGATAAGDKSEKSDEKKDGETKDK